jgi:DNA-directed RNA polymerase specialized sigma24 family protein
MKINPEIKASIYVNSNDFKRQIQEYYESDKMTDQLAVNVVKIAEGLSYNWRFINYTKSWKEEMVGDAVIKMYSALEGKKYDMDSGYNPFSYFNQIAWNAFTNRIKKENRQHEGLQEYKQMLYEQNMIESEGNVYTKPSGFLDDDNSSENFN